MLEDFERLLHWHRKNLGPVDKPLRCQFLASDLERPPSNPDNTTLRAPDDPSPAASLSFRKKSLPLSRLPDVEAKFKSLPPGLTRKQQCEEVRNSPEFAEYDLTVRMLLKAAKVVQVRLGRPPKPKQS
jgi:hypothetical protein